MRCGDSLCSDHLLQQIINDKGEFGEQECRALLESEGASSWKQVQLRGVIGGTASGKSTLLNQLVRPLLTSAILLSWRQ